MAIIFHKFKQSLTEEQLDAFLDYENDEGYACHQMIVTSNGVHFEESEYELDRIVAHFDKVINRVLTLDSTVDDGDED